MVPQLLTVRWVARRQQPRHYVTPHYAGVYIYIPCIYVEMCLDCSYPEQRGDRIHNDEEPGPYDALDCTSLERACSLCSVVPIQKAQNTKTVRSASVLYSLTCCSADWQRSAKNTNNYKKRIHPSLRSSKVQRQLTVCTQYTTHCTLPGTTQHHRRGTKK